MIRRLLTAALGLTLTVATATAVPLDTVLTHGESRYNGRQAVADNFGFDSVATFQFIAAGGSDCWGWTAPDGTEYAFMGVLDGVAVVNVTDLTVVQEVAMTPGGCGATWRDLKTYQHYLYVVSECSGLNQGLLVIDLQYLPDSVSVVGSFPVDGTASHTSHNLSIDTVQGYAYVEGAFSPSVYIHDLSNPEAPVFVGGFQQTGIHDLHAHDNRVYTADGTNPTFSVWDVADKLNPTLLARVTIPNPGYVHNIWPSGDGRYVVTTEETANKTIKIWDIADLDNITLVGEYLGDSRLAHNAHFQNGLIYVSHYESGVLVIDPTSPSLPQLVGAFDTYPIGESPSFNGCWGVYPHNASGLVYASNDNGKLFILRSLASIDLPAAVAINLGDENPTQVVGDQPTFYWSFRDTVGSQTAYQLEVGTDTDWSVAEMFATGELISTDTSHLYTGDPLIEGATYFFRLRVNNGLEWGEWRTGRFTMNRTPSGPTILSPGSGATLVFDFVQLKVLNGADTDGDRLFYDFEVYRDAALTMRDTLVAAVPQTADSTSSGFLSLDPNELYYWRARTFDGGEYSAWSGVAQFQTRENARVTVPTEFGSIAAAYAAVSYGDTIRLAAGSYEEQVLVIDKHVHIVGDGPGATTLSMPTGETGNLIEFGNVSGPVTVSGLTLVGGGAARVINLPTNQQSTVTNNYIIDHTATGGRTIDITGGNALIANNLFSGNNALAVVFASFGDVRVIDNTFDNNRRGVVSNSAVTAYNNSFTNLTDEALIGSFVDNDFNNFFNNGANASSGITLGNNSLTVDPQYVDPPALDYRLENTSPLIDVGHPDPRYNDLDGSRSDIGAFGPRVPTDIGDGDGVRPFSYSLSNNYPNPFNPSTTISYSLAQRGPVTLRVYNSLGQVVSTLVNEIQPAGAYEVEWDGRSASGNRVASGLYFYRLEAGEFVKSRKMVLLK